MRTKEKFHLYSFILLVITAGLHLMPLFFLFLERGFDIIQLDSLGSIDGIVNWVNEIGFVTLGEAGFGLIYLVLAVLLFFMGDYKIVQIMGFLIPLIGCFIAIGLLIMSFDVLLFIMFLIDLLIVPMRFYVYKLNNKNIIL